MHPAKSLDLTRRDFLHTGMAGAAAMALSGPNGLLAPGDHEAVVFEIARRHDATLRMLRDWIALPSIAAENRNYPQGAEYMARLARDAGFGRVDIIATAGKPGVFATLDAGAASTLALYFMYDVKQFDPSEWSSPPLEGRIVDRPGVGKVMIGRGATNTKGPQTACLAALHAFKAAGRKLPVNLVLVCEGEEEIGCIEGLVGGYTGPGGKTILPNRAVAKIDVRLVPGMTAKGTLDLLKKHLAKHGFSDVEVNMTGGYDPTETPADSRLVKAMVATYHKAGIDPVLWPRLAGSWPGVTFTGAPLKLPAGQFGLGHGAGAHAPDEYWLIESANPKVAGMDGAVRSYVDLFYELA